MKICFSEEKLIKKFGTPLSTNPTISEQFFHDSPLCPNSKKREPPTHPHPPTHPLHFRGEENMMKLKGYSPKKQNHQGKNIKTKFSSALKPLMIQ